MKITVRMMHQVQMILSALFRASDVSSLAILFFCSTHTSTAHMRCYTTSDPSTEQGTDAQTDRQPEREDTATDHHHVAKNNWMQNSCWADGMQAETTSQTDACCKWAKLGIS